MTSATTTHTTLLVRLVDADNQAAWREFCDRYGDLIRGFTRRRGLQHADADDVVQDVLMSLVKVMPGFEYDRRKGKFRSYLKTATIRAILIRSRQKRPVVGIGDIEDAVSAAASDTEVDAAWEIEWRQYHMRLAMRTIQVEFDESCRRIFNRYVIETVDAKDVATAFGVRTDYVYQVKSRIMKRLGQLIEAQIQDEG